MLREAFETACAWLDLEERRAENARLLRAFPPRPWLRRGGPLLAIGAIGLGAFFSSRLSTVALTVDTEPARAHISITAGRHEFTGTAPMQIRVPRNSQVRVRARGLDTTLEVEDEPLMFVLPLGLVPEQERPAASPLGDFEPP